MKDLIRRRPRQYFVYSHPVAQCTTVKLLFEGHCLLHLVAGKGAKNHRSFRDPWNVTCISKKKQKNKRIINSFVESYNYIPIHKPRSNNSALQSSRAAKEPFGVEWQRQRHLLSQQMTMTRLCPHSSPLPNHETFSKWRCSEVVDSADLLLYTQNHAVICYDGAWRATHFTGCCMSHCLAPLFSQMHDMAHYSVKCMIAPKPWGTSVARNRPPRQLPTWTKCRTVWSVVAPAAGTGGEG